MRASVGKHLLLLTGFAATACTFRSAAAAQDVAADVAGRAVSTVMDYRRAYLDDPLPFDACAVQRAVGEADFGSRIVHHVRGMLDDVESPCPRPFTQGRSVVLVDSVRLSDSAANVYLTVLRGELIHREDYTLQPAGTAVYMGVRQVRLWGGAQAYPARPRRGP